MERLSAYKTAKWVLAWRPGLQQKTHARESRNPRVLALSRHQVGLSEVSVEIRFTAEDPRSRVSELSVTRSVEAVTSLVYRDRFTAMSQPGQRDLCPQFQPLGGEYTRPVLERVGRKTERPGFPWTWK
ncbi:hypothetical protein NL676_015918 [Syzygium grande]|nr:hypothetical protein NL676_015918 [Syzygium grande]